MQTTTAQNRVLVTPYSEAEEQELVRHWRLKYVTTLPRHAVHDEKSIRGFAGPFRFLSNFWPAKIPFEDRIYPSVEHAFHAGKYPPNEREIFLSITPAQARALGCNAIVSEAWWNDCLTRMEGLARLKFEHSPILRARLLATAPKYLEETNSWGDQFWGVYQGQGSNKLGKILMHIREQLAVQTAGSGPALTHTSSRLSTTNLSDGGTRNV
jgi:N-glycosidase YbiA